MFVRPQLKDQQEAERKKVTSQEIQKAIAEQTLVIRDKQVFVKEDLDKVEPAVIDAQNGRWSVSWVSQLLDSGFFLSEKLQRLNLK